MIKAGDAKGSELFHRITLPRTDDDFMPAENKRPLSPSEVKLIELWISAGASGTQAADAIKDLPMDSSSTAVAEVSIEEIDPAVVARQRAALAPTVAQLQKQFPDMLQYESRGSANLVVDMSLAGFEVWRRRSGRTQTSGRSDCRRGFLQYLHYRPFRDCDRGNETSTLAASRAHENHRRDFAGAWRTGSTRVGKRLRNGGYTRRSADRGANAQVAACLCWRNENCNRCFHTRTCEEQTRILTTRENCYNSAKPPSNP